MCFSLYVAVKGSSPAVDAALVALQRRPAHLRQLGEAGPACGNDNAGQQHGKGHMQEAALLGIATGLQRAATRKHRDWLLPAARAHPQSGGAAGDGVGPCAKPAAA